MKEIIIEFVSEYAKQITICLMALVFIKALMGKEK